MLVLPKDFPAGAELTKLGVGVISREDLPEGANTVKVVLLNLMPNKIDAEVEFLAPIGSSSLYIEPVFLYPSTHKISPTSAEHIQKFYVRPQDISEQKFDAMISTGAALGGVEFAEVDFWDEYQSILQWAQKYVFSTIFGCWSSYAALYHNHGIERARLENMVVGIYEHSIFVNANNRKVLHGFGDSIFLPHTRYNDFNWDQVANSERLEIVVPNAIVASTDFREIYILAHPEYRRGAIDKLLKTIPEYFNGHFPINYYPDDNPDNTPYFHWSPHANLFYRNWLSFVNQHKTKK
jgi:homoserine O-succinyltransferase